MSWWCTSCLLYLGCSLLGHNPIVFSARLYGGSLPLATFFPVNEGSVGRLPSPVPYWVFDVLHDVLHRLPSDDRWVEMSLWCTSCLLSLGCSLLGHNPIVFSARLYGGSLPLATFFPVNEGSVGRLPSLTGKN